MFTLRFKSRLFTGQHVLLSAFVVLAAAGAVAHATPVPSPTGALFREVDAKPAQGPQAEGLAALARGDCAAAEREFKRAAQAQPQDAQPLLGLAECAFRRRQVEEAGKWLSQAAKVGERDPAVWASRGRYAAQLKRWEEAVAAWNQAITLNPTEVRSRLDLADLLATNGRSAEAEPLLREVLRLEPGHAGAHYALGMVQMRRGDLGGAAQWLQQAGSLAAGNPLPWVGLSRVELARGRGDAALAAVDRALAIQPQLTEALLLRADALEASGRVDQAVEALQSLAKAQPKSGVPSMRLGMVEQSRGRAQPAIAAYKEALAREPQLAPALNNLALLTVETRGDLKQAEAWSREALRLLPKSAQFHDTLATVLQARGQTAQALASAEAAHQLAPKDADLLWHLAQLTDAAGNKAKGKELAQKALTMSPAKATAEQIRQWLAKG